jgi:branched-chain amino acid transport system ATP-binding protein
MSAPAPQNDKPLLVGRGLEVRFGGVRALQGVDLTVPQGRVVALIGPNGAGKTTLFNLVTGFYRPTAGTLTFEGHDLTRLPPWRIARLGILRTFQTLRLFPTLSVLDNALAGRHMHGGGEPWQAVLGLGAFHRAERMAQERALEALARVGLADRAHQPAGSLPYGDQRRLEIARALAGEPRLLLLDEPAAGMNQAERRPLAALIRDLCQQDGITVLVVEHDMRFVAGVADEVVVLDHGVELARGTPEEVRRHPKVIEAYLGSGRGSLAPGGPAACRG